MKYITLLMLLLVTVGAVYGVSGTVVLVSDNAADAAVADTVKEVKGTDVTIIKARWGEFDEATLTQIKAAAASSEGILIIGGPAAVVSDYEEKLAEFNITRLAGATRKETSAAVLRHFKNDFRGRRIAIAYGGDEEGIQEALKRAKANRGMVLFVDTDDVPTEVEDALNEANASDVDAVLSPNVNETRIRERIEARTKAKIREVVKGNTSDRADHMIKSAAEKVEEMDRALAEINVTKQALTTLSTEAHSKLEDARKAYSEGNYGRAFGHAVSAKSIAENTLRMAKKLRSFEDRGTAREVKAKIVARYKSLLEQVLRVEKVMLLEKVTLPEDSKNLLTEARDHLKEARLAMESDDFGQAIIHLDAAEHKIAQLKVSLIRKNLDEKKIRRAAVNVTEDDLSREETKDVARRR